MSNPTSMEEHPHYQQALLWAKKNGMVGMLYRVEDAWGGYWQCKTKNGIYNFSTGKDGSVKIIYEPDDEGIEAELVSGEIA